jgi:hypothetical protein
MDANEDYDYIIKIIQYLDRQFNIRFFISSKDFDVLYRWWEKRIPYSVVSESLRQVVERRLRKKKPLVSFSIFSQEVRYNYQSFLSLHVGRERIELQEEHDEINTFLRNYPAALDSLRSDFGALCFEYLQNNKADPGPFYEKLLTHFQNDAELNTKSEWFLKNLAPPLRSPEIEKKYCLNYLLHKFSIPNFD